MTPEEPKNERFIEELRQNFNEAFVSKQINHRLSGSILKIMINQVIAVALFVPVYYYLIRPLFINLSANIIETHNAALFNENPNFIAPSTQNEVVKPLKQQTAVNSRLIKPIDSVVFDLMALLSISLPFLFTLIKSLSDRSDNSEEQ